MLDSLVRVSRRVGGAADLLATEMQAVQEYALVIRACSSTRLGRSQERGAHPQGANFTHGLGPPKAVRRVKGERNKTAKKADEHAESLRITNAQAAPKSA